MTPREEAGASGIETRRTILATGGRLSGGQLKCRCSHGKFDHSGGRASCLVSDCGCETFEWIGAVSEPATLAYRIPVQSADNVDPGVSWEFDETVAASFDDMLARSIPQYRTMRATVAELAFRAVERPRNWRQAHVVDLGASRGEALASVAEKFGSDARYTAVEIAPAMLESLRARFPEKNRAKHGTAVVEYDLREGYPAVGHADVTLAILTVQFVPIEHRLRLLRDVWRHTKPGGALILVEKVLGATADLDATFVDLYYSLKGENGYSEEAIQRKRLALEGVLVPVTAGWNEDLLRGAGFGEVDCFFRWCNFAGWIAVRAE